MSRTYSESYDYTTSFGEVRTATFSKRIPADKCL